MKLENNNTKISISKQMMEVVENVFTLTVRVLTQASEFFLVGRQSFLSSLPGPFLLEPLILESLLLNSTNCTTPPFSTHCPLLKK